MSLENLEEELHYLHASELQEILEKLKFERVVIQKAKKAELIKMIIVYLSTGKRLSLPEYPKQSLGKKSMTQTITADALMLKGIHKNNLETREFFKKMIGGHFHFTVFGLDWLEERWRDGRPPTYGEFVKMWKEKYELYKTLKIPPKAEWKYIIFVQNYIKMNQNVRKEEINIAWDKRRREAVEEVKNFLNGVTL